MRIVVAKAVQTHTIQPFIGLNQVVTFCNATHIQGGARIFGNCPMRKQRELLKHHRQHFAPQVSQLLFAIGQHVFTIDLHLSRGGLDQTVEMADQCGFARSGQAHDDGDFTFAHVYIDVLEAKDMLMLA